VDEVWSRNLRYIADALNMDLDRMRRAAYCKTFTEFRAALNDTKPEN
jgi:hypothetical protein